MDPADTGEAVIEAKEALIVAGTEVASDVFRRVEERLVVGHVLPDGTKVDEGGVVMRVRGPLRGILTGERVALNFLGRLSGIATLTRRYVDAVAGTGARVLDTRKTTPGLRALEKAAVKAGGGENHRLGLYDMIMAKDNHLVAAGGLKAAVEAIQARNKQGLDVEVEVDTLEQLNELLPLGVDRVLLDNMDLGRLREAVGRVRALGERRPLSEASGNVTLATVRAVADTGVDFISVGALTHSAPRADLSLRVLGS